MSERLGGCSDYRTNIVKTGVISMRRRFSARNLVFSAAVFRGNSYSFALVNVATLKTMFRITGASVYKVIKEYGMMTVGIMLYAFAYVGIIIPAGGVGGGASGLALLIYYATGGDGGGIPMGVSFFVINAVLILAAVFIIGAHFGIKTIYCIIVISLTMGFIQGFFPPDLLGLADDKLLSAILGGAVSGIGVSMCLMQGGSTGGSDIAAMIINKYRNISYGKVYVAWDFTVIGCSIFIFHNIAAVIYGYVLVVTFSYTVDMILAGNRQSQQLLIMSHRHDEIADMIVNSMHRGVTILDGTGWYTKKPVKVVLVVCRKTEANMLLKSVKAIDPQAFITMGSVMGVYGEGFDKLKK